MGVHVMKQPETGCESVTEGVWHCKQDAVAIVSASKEEVCPVCLASMVHIGWVESVKKS